MGSAYHAAHPRVGVLSHTLRHAAVTVCSRSRRLPPPALPPTSTSQCEMSGLKVSPRPLGAPHQGTRQMTSGICAEQVHAACAESRHQSSPSNIHRARTHGAFSKPAEPPTGNCGALYCEVNLHRFVHNTRYVVGIMHHFAQFVARVSSLVQRNTGATSLRSSKPSHGSTMHAVQVQYGADVQRKWPAPHMCSWYCQDSTSTFTLHTSPSSPLRWGAPRPSRRISRLGPS